MLAGQGKHHSDTNIIMLIIYYIEASILPDDRPARMRVTKISISLSNDVLDWIHKNKDEQKVSTFINKVLREKMQSDDNSCNISVELRRIEKRLEALEKGFTEGESLRNAFAGDVGRISPATTRPADLFCELVSIKNVSAENARAVLLELITFMRKNGTIDRSLVLRDLFPDTKSTITNDINYWYNACKAIIDRLIETGYVEKAGRGKYRWLEKTDSIDTPFV